MKTNAIIRIVLFSLAILILLGILVAVVGFNMYVVNGRVRFDNQERVEVPAEIINKNVLSSEIQNLDIEWVAGSITIQKDENVTDIQITEMTPVDTKYQTICKQSGQTLKIQFCEETITFPSFGVNIDVSKDLVITVPAGWTCNKIDIDAAATEVEIHGLTINEFDFDGASGELTLDNCNIDVLDIDTASGDVEFTGTLKELEFDAASARFDGEFYECPNKLDLDAMSGDLTLVLPEYCGFDLKLDTMSGSFDSDFDFNTMGASYKSGDGACKIKVSAMSGDVSILKGIKPVENCNH